MVAAERWGTMLAVGCWGWEGVHCVEERKKEMRRDFMWFPGGKEGVIVKV